MPSFLERLPNDLKNFKILRNKVSHMIRELKQYCNEILVNKLKSNLISSCDWWTTLKIVISSNSSASVLPLQYDVSLSSDNLDKATVLNDFFRDQIVIDETNTALLQIDPYNVNSNVYILHFIPDETESVMKTLKTGKATGLDGINNYILRELLKELAV